MRTIVKLLIFFLININAFSAQPKQEQLSIYPYDSKIEREPFAPLIDEKGEIKLQDKQNISSYLSVDGIVFDQQGGMVAINGGFYREGDFIGENKIKKIYPNGVVVEKKEGGEVFLKWEGE